MSNFTVILRLLTTPQFGTKSQISIFNISFTKILVFVLRKFPPKPSMRQISINQQFFWARPWCNIWSCWLRSYDKPIRVFPGDLWSEIWEECDIRSNTNWCLGWFLQRKYFVESLQTAQLTSSLVLGRYDVTMWSGCWGWMPTWSWNKLFAFQSIKVFPGKPPDSSAVWQGHDITCGMDDVKFHPRVYIVFADHIRPN